MQPEQILQRQTSLSSDAILGEFELRYSVDEDANLYARIASGAGPLIWTPPFRGTESLSTPNILTRLKLESKTVVAGTHADDATAVPAQSS